MKKLRDEGPVIGEVGDLMLARVRGTRSPKACGRGRAGVPGQGADAWAAVHSALSLTAPPGTSCSRWPPGSARPSPWPWTWSRPGSARTAGSRCSCRCAPCSPPRHSGHPCWLSEAWGSPRGPGSGTGESPVSVCPPATLTRPLGTDHCSQKAPDEPSAGLAHLLVPVCP